MSWRPIPRAELASWNQRLFSTDASLFQYPFWAEPFRKMHFQPRYLAYHDGASERAYVSVLSIGVPRFRIGLVLRGPGALARLRVPAVLALVGGGAAAHRCTPAREPR